MQKKKPGVKRVTLLLDPTEVPEEQIEVICSGYGKLLGELVIGKLVGINTRVFTIQFKDEDGYYYEKYLVGNGVRTEDMGDREQGWRLDPSDIYPKLPEPEVPLPVFNLLSKEAIPYPGDPKDIMYLEVWEEEEQSTHYLRAYRTGTVGDGALKHPKDLPCVVPFDKLKQLLYDFESVLESLPEEE